MTKQWKSRQLILWIAIALFATNASWGLAQSVTLLSDDCGDGDFSPWITFEAGWSESGGVCRSANTGANIPVEAVYSQGFDWTGYTAEADVRTSSSRLTSDLRLMVRDNGVPTTQTGRGFGSCSLFRNNFNQTFLVAGIHGALSNQQLLPFNWFANTTYRLRARVSGDTLTCEVVGVPGASLSVTDPMLPPAGSIALRATHIPGEFDNILVLGSRPENHPPVAEAGADQIVAADAGCSAEVTLDGSASFDPDGDPLSYRWESSSVPLLTGASPTVTLPLGRHEFTLTVDDGRGGEDTDTVAVTVVDRMPPSVGPVFFEPEVLWPPNHKLRAVRTTVSARDNCDPAPACRIAGVASSDPADGRGDGHTEPDGLLTGDLGLELRAERSGGSDRVYTITVACTDAAGNEGTATGTVLVPAHR